MSAFISIIVPVKTSCCDRPPSDFRAARVLVSPKSRRRAYIATAITATIIEVEVFNHTGTQLENQLLINGTDDINPSS